MHLKATYTINICMVYHADDQKKLDELRFHLRDLNEKNKGYIINKIWINSLGVNRQETEEILAAADLILLLMSDNSVLSSLFLSDEVKQTLEQHYNKRSVVVPIILNTCWWEDTIFSELEVLPKAGLPIYDSTNVKNELFHQVVEGLGGQLIKIQQYKKDLETLFRHTIEEAETIFNGWQKKPEILRAALPLFQQAKGYWREGFSPNEKKIESYIAVCYREIDFKHYSKAAYEAYKAGDFQTCYFNCKDALDLRDDALLRELYEQVATKLEAIRLAKNKEPFEKALRKAQAYFLALEWQKAEEFFKLSLEKYQAEFEPTEKVILHKIEICRREFVLENSLNEAERLYQTQNYQRMADTLMRGIRDINHDAFYRIDYIVHLIGLLENVEAYRDLRLDQWGFRNKENGTIIIAPKYTAAYNFTENLAGVKKWDKWGFVDIEGNEIIPFKYDYVSSFQNGIAQVIVKRDTWCINHAGETVEADIIRKEVPILPK